LRLADDDHGLDLAGNLGSLLVFDPRARHGQTVATGFKHLLHSKLKFIGVLRAAFKGNRILDQKERLRRSGKCNPPAFRRGFIK
jgi:hypothetical protein